ncbi:hypothetical protein DFS34DRAFT_289474 [Phlyctochytrium arcticum]|nr:hypothetical protein DFS34DRAFT_289474 [Phlyctochytrium arcticum]
MVASAGAVPAVWAIFPVPCPATTTTAAAAMSTTTLFRLLLVILFSRVLVLQFQSVKSLGAERLATALKYASEPPGIFEEWKSSPRRRFYRIFHRRSFDGSGLVEHSRARRPEPFISNLPASGMHDYTTYNEGSPTAEGLGEPEIWLGGLHLGGGLETAWECGKARGYQSQVLGIRLGWSSQGLQKHHALVPFYCEWHGGVEI